MEVIDHDLGLLSDRVVVRLHVVPQFLRRSLRIELGIILDGLHQPVVALDRRVIGQHVQDEPLLDCLLHRVAVERAMLDLACRAGAARQRRVALGIGFAEHLQRLVLRRGRESEVAGVRQHLPGLHDPVDLVLVALLFFRSAVLGQCDVHLRRRAAALAGMRLVNHDGELASPVLVADLVQDEGELLDRGDNDLLALAQEAPQVAAPLRMADCRGHLRELLDRVLDLLVEHAPVGHDDYGVEMHRPACRPGAGRWRVFPQRDKLVG